MSRGRLIIIASILAAFVPFLDGSAVNVALPAIRADLGGGLALQQWVVDAYLVTLSAFILIAGSLSDIIGRVRILNVGLLLFGAASILCAVAPDPGWLVAARAIQGVGGALVVPSSLALIIATFHGEAEGRAIGTWTAWTGIAFVIGPPLAGFLVDLASWRWVFAINVFPVALTILFLRRLQEIKPQSEPARVDLMGAVLCAIGLGGIVFSLIEQPVSGWSSPEIYFPLIIGVLSFGLFLWRESHVDAPMLPLGLFRVGNFAVGNLATIAIYAGLSVATFLIVLYLQQVAGYSAIAAGLALLPITAVMFALSPRFGALAGRLGPRLFMTLGPFVAAAGFLLLLKVNLQADYWRQVFPGVILFALGLSMTVAPLTSAVLGSIESRHAGIGSAVNNAVARVAGLLGVALIGLVIGPHFGAEDKTASLIAFRTGVEVMAALMLLGGLVAALGIHNPRRN